MRRVLYLISSASADVSLIPAPGDPAVEASVVLIEGAVNRKDIPAPHVYTMSQEITGTPTYPSVTSGDLIRMIFEADSVVTL